MQRSVLGKGLLAPQTGRTGLVRYNRSAQNKRGASLQQLGHSQESQSGQVGFLSAPGLRKEQLQSLEINPGDRLKAEHEAAKQVRYPFLSQGERQLMQTACTRG